MSLKQGWWRQSTAAFKRQPTSGLASMNVKQSPPTSSVTGAVLISYNYDYNNNHDSQN